MLKACDLHDIVLLVLNIIVQRHNMGPNKEKIFISDHNTILILIIQMT